MKLKIPERKYISMSPAILFKIVSEKAMGRLNDEQFQEIQRLLNGGQLDELDDSSEAYGKKALENVTQYAYEINEQLGKNLEKFFSGLQ